MTTQSKRKTPAGGSLESLYEQFGGMQTCLQLSEQFHDRVASDPVLREIFPKNLGTATERLALFLAERLGGPPDYTAKRGKNSLVCRHAHVPIGAVEGERWLGHMFATLEALGLPDTAQRLLRDYFTQTAATLADPFLPFYHLPLAELRAHLEQNPALATTSDMGRNLLSEAAGRWDLPRVQLLLEHGADVNVTDHMGHNPLYRACNGHAPERESEGRAVVELLIQHGANVNGKSGVGQMTPLHMAARRDNTLIAEALLKAGAELETKDSKEETPLRRAVNCGQEGMVRLLLAHGADPLTKDKLSRTPLDAARQERIREALQDATSR